MNETQLKNKVKAMLKKEFPLVYAQKINDRCTHGIPDFLMCVCGRFVAIELKVKGNKPTKIQEYHTNNIIKSGGIAKVCYTVNEVRETLKEVDNETNRTTG